MGGVDIESIPTAVAVAAADPLDKRLHAKGVKEYRHLIGQLVNWLATRTRPDLLYVTTRLARVLEHPQGDHTTVYKQILRYLYCTADLGITFSPGGTPMNETGESGLWRKLSFSFRKVGSRKRSAGKNRWKNSIVKKGKGKDSEDMVFFKKRIRKGEIRRRMKDLRFLQENEGLAE